jgi:hypothetical protein
MRSRRAWEKRAFAEATRINRYFIQELGLATNEFVDLVKCPLSTEDFLAARTQKLASGLRILRRG